MVAVFLFFYFQFFYKRKPCANFHRSEFIYFFEFSFLQKLKKRVIIFLYVFILQTYGFTKTSGNIQKRTFVRFVEDEGSAYMAGLREGDIIVEVGEQNVEEMEHIKIVELITKANTELKYVVENLSVLNLSF